MKLDKELFGIMNKKISIGATGKSQSLLVLAQLIAEVKKHFNKVKFLVKLLVMNPVQFQALHIQEDMIPEYKMYIAD